MNILGSDVPVGFEVPPFRRTITRAMAITHASPMKNFHTVLEDAQAVRWRFIDLESYAKTLDCRDEATAIAKQFDPREPLISAEELQELTATLTSRLRNRRQLRVVKQE